MKKTSCRIWSYLLITKSDPSTSLRLCEEGKQDKRLHENCESERSVWNKGSRERAMKRRPIDWNRGWTCRERHGKQWGGSHRWKDRSFEGQWGWGPSCLDGRAPGWASREAYLSHSRAAQHRARARASEWERKKEEVRKGHAQGYEELGRGYKGLGISNTDYVQMVNVAWWDACPVGFMPRSSVT